MSNLALPTARRIRGRALLAAGLVALFSVACADQPAGPDAMVGGGFDLEGIGPDGQSVVGSGHVTVDGSLRVFTVSARKDVDGAVSGQTQLMNDSGTHTLHAAIDCVAVYDNLAVLSGVTTREKGFPPGEAVFFAVEDNGQGAGSPADRITLAFIGGAPIPNLCELVGIPPAVLLLPVEKGNISVRD